MRTLISCLLVCFVLAVVAFASQKAEATDHFQQRQFVVQQQFVPQHHVQQFRVQQFVVQPQLQRQKVIVQQQQVHHVPQRVIIQQQRQPLFQRQSSRTVTRSSIRVR